MTADLYPRPSREEIAARVGFDVTLPAPAPKPQLLEMPDPLACFATHLSARMRALGWDQATLQDRAQIGSHVAAKAMNGTGCDLALAGRLAALVGGYLAAMIGPYICSTCTGEPPAGFACLECGAESRAA